jgi:hypothetical protein
MPLACIKNPYCCGEFLDTAEITLLRVSACQVTTWFRSDAISSSDMKERATEGELFFVSALY